MQALIALIQTRQSSAINRLYGFKGAALATLYRAT
jgi:hypothetical protein